MIVGAGDAGKTVVRKLLNSKYVENFPICFIDDDQERLGTEFHGIKVVGTTADIEKIIHKENIKEIFICMPSVEKSTVNGIYGKFKSTDCNVKIFPGVYQFINGNLSLRIRELEITDFLGRTPINVIDEKPRLFIRTKLYL